MGKAKRKTKNGRRETGNGKRKDFEQLEVKNEKLHK